MYVPIAGNNVNIGRQEFIQHGEVVCEGRASNSVTLTDSKWKTFNPATRSVVPVSDRWLSETLKLYVGHLSTLPVMNSVAVVTKDWGKPWKQDARGADTLSIWRESGDAWYVNYIGLIERKGCLRLVMLLPGASAFMPYAFDRSETAKSNVERLIFSGEIPAYFYKPQEGCEPAAM